MSLLWRKSKKSYYPYEIKYKNKSRVYLWREGNRKDEFLTDGTRLVSFPSIKEAVEYGKENSIKVVKEESQLVIRRVFIIKSEIDCEYFLSLWNCASDICNSVGKRFWGDSKKSLITKVYDKVFWGNNLPAVTPEGEQYTPYFTWKERIILKALHKSFMKVFDEYLE